MCTLRRERNDSSPVCVLHLCEKTLGPCSYLLRRKSLLQYQFCRLLNLVKKKLICLPPSGIVGANLFTWICSVNNKMNLSQRAEDYVGSLLIAEALAIRLALMEAQNMGINDVHVNSDLQVLIRVIQKKELIKELVGILQDIYELSCCFSYISCTDNFSADSLAKRALCAFIAS
ncbi:hypothetical protein F2Q68_00015876 [Brassica cretica]|uniref:RNase H type-1 domain-containing protein n=2 Tax=Brassica cretica TaxID=69181 RepID=A0ABQ7EYK3_BRACR|nr:hypothetical protein F2Q68_00015876 [Brassica cretica]KAF3608594.1 hypothetical protein DY000_02048425 [Brassica cretica]